MRRLLYILLYIIYSVPDNNNFIVDSFFIYPVNTICGSLKNKILYSCNEKR